MSSQKYYPYGRTRSGDVSATTDKLFTGHQQEGELYFAQARFYPSLRSRAGSLLGRFTQPDTACPERSRRMPEPGNPQAFNRYSYVLNNPLRYLDPTGHEYEPSPCVLGIGCDASQFILQQQMRANAFAWGCSIDVDACNAILYPQDPAPEVECCSLEEFYFGGTTGPRTVPGTPGVAVAVGAAIVQGCTLWCDDLGEGFQSGANQLCSWLTFCSSDEQSSDEAPTPRTRTVGEEARRHILEGDPETGTGGHAPHATIPGASHFPEDWSDDDVIEAIEAVANHEVAGSGEWTRSDGRIVVDATVDGVDIQVIVERDDREIITGYPYP